MFLIIIIFPFFGLWWLYIRTKGWVIKCYYPKYGTIQSQFEGYSMKYYKRIKTLFIESRKSFRRWWWCCFFDDFFVGGEWILKNKFVLVVEKRIISLFYESFCSCAINFMIQHDFYNFIFRKKQYTISFVLIT